MTPPQDSDYDQDFFEWVREGSRRSARIIVPLIIELCSPSSVVDVGCGTGEWLAEFQQHGVDDVMGVDGKWLPKSQLSIAENCFTELDLASPGRPDNRYDIALCLEVAEHLPPASAVPVVSYLTASAPIIIFSAAVPGQGGVGHVNEQWLDYWVDLFVEHSYEMFDVFRSAIWNDERIEPWYAQNTVVFADSRADPMILRQLRDHHEPLPLRVVHPLILTYAIWGATASAEH
jgi:SAM-dependent methyltransferase